MLALQRSVNGFDGQLSYFTRYDNLHFMPDPVGDLLLNGIASDISRSSYTNGLQGDASYVDQRRPIRCAPASPSAAKKTGSTIRPGSSRASICDRQPTTAPPNDHRRRREARLARRRLCPGRVEDHRQADDQRGLRFDQMWQYVDANQLSPRLSFTYKPFEYTTFHAGYARYFTPPVLVEAAPSNIALFNDTTGAPISGGTESGAAGALALFRRRRRSDHSVRLPHVALERLPDARSRPRRLLQARHRPDRQWQFRPGAGAERLQLCPRHCRGHRVLRQISRAAISRPTAISPSARKRPRKWCRTSICSTTSPRSPHLGGLTEYQYIATHWIYTDHTQLVTGSAGLSYLWNGTRFSTDMIYGSGLRTGDANIGTEPPYAQFNAGLSHEFAMPDAKPLTVRFDVVNLFDTHLPDQKRHRHRRVCPAIRTAPRLLHRHFQENMRSVMSSIVRLVAAAFGLLAVTELAWGADLSPPRAPAAYNWTGLYIGLNAGYASAKVTNTVSGGGLDGSGSVNMPAGIGGAQIGFNYEIGSVVFGFEADFDGNMATKSSATITSPNGTTSGTDQIPWIGTLRGRVGYAFDRLLLYATAGGAATQLNSTVNVGAVGSASTTNTHGAWTAGGGLEAAITDELSARLEYPLCRHRQHQCGAGRRAVRYSHRPDARQPDTGWPELSVAGCMVAAPRCRRSVRHMRQPARSCAAAGDAGCLMQ